ALLGVRSSRPDAPRAVPGNEPLAGYETFVLRTLAKRQIAREAAAGQRPLPEAAALFGQLNRLPPRLDPPEHSVLPGPTEGERLCRQVVSYVGFPEPDWPPDAAGAGAARLTAELEVELALRGTVRLPDPAGLPPATALVDRIRAGLTDAQRRTLLPEPVGQFPPE
ncbi:MAG: hypothetical protein J2P46_20190, partial [Zavarzinella sp.]|nr:hypothetical protein [Zavarzinella sp.]